MGRPMVGLSVVQCFVFNDDANVWGMMQNRANQEQRFYLNIHGESWLLFPNAQSADFSPSFSSP